jgi:hypothetical protein
MCHGKKKCVCVCVCARVCACVCMCVYVRVCFIAYLVCIELNVKYSIYSEIIKWLVI